jgi:hypothetical protein
MARTVVMRVESARRKAMRKSWQLFTDMQNLRGRLDHI